MMTYKCGGTIHVDKCTTGMQVMTHWGTGEIVAFTKMSVVLTPIYSFATSSLRRTVGHKCNFTNMFGVMKHNSEKKDCH